MDEHDLAFALAKGRHVAEYTARNLLSSYALRFIVAPLDRSTVRAHVIVGAGPDLARSLDMIRRLRHRGAAIVATNSALPILVAEGITPDVTLLRESVDNRDVMALAGDVVADIGAHPESARAGSGRLSWCIPTTPRCLGLVPLLGVPTIPAGPTVLTMGVALALQQCAIPIIVGADCGVYDGEAAYHPGARRGAVRVHAGDGAIMLHGDSAVDDEAHRAVGQDPPPGIVHAARVESIDGRELWADGTHAAQIESLEQLAAHHPDCTDARRQGARLRGWHPIGHGLPPLDRPAPGVYTTAAVSAADTWSALGREAAMLDVIGRSIADGPDARIPTMAELPALGAPMAEAFAATETARIRQRYEADGSLSTDDGRVACAIEVAAAYCEGAERLAEILG